MLLTTTNNIEGKRITQYYGIVTGETIIGANVFRDFMAGIRDFLGGRSGSYEKVLREAQMPSSESTSTMRPWAKAAACSWSRHPEPLCASNNTIPL